MCSEHNIHNDSHSHDVDQATSATLITILTKADQIVESLRVLNKSGIRSEQDKEQYVVHLTTLTHLLDTAYDLVLTARQKGETVTLQSLDLLEQVSYSASLTATIPF